MSFSTYKRSDFNHDFHRSNNDRYDFHRSNEFRSRNTSESSFGSPNYHHQATKLCESWASGKSCRFGSRCWYAHGPWELKHYNDNHDYLNEFANSQQPTLAQKQWMMMSQQSEQNQAYAHEAILMGNRFNGGRSEARSCNLAPAHSKHDYNTKRNNKKTNNYYNTISKRRENTIQPLIELLKDVDEAPLRTNSPMPFSFPSTESLNQATYSHENIDHLANLIASLDFIKADQQKTNTHEICDIYAISGFCPLGEDCCFEHRPRLP